MNEIYFDNSATTQPSEGVVAIVNETLQTNWGNPSSMHSKGIDSEKYIKATSRILSNILKVKEQEIVYTSGGTEANNQAIFGTAYASRRKGKKILITAMEHPAVREPVRFLEGMGFEVIEIPVNSQGELDLDSLKEQLDEDVILVSTMMVNNEVGSVVPVEEVGRMVHEYAPNALYHVDGIQAFGKMRIYPKRMGIDLLSVSGHKFHGPKGVGFLYVSEDARISSLLFGGGQMGGRRSGTENIPGIAGLGVAAKEVYTSFDEKIQHLYELREYLIEKLEELDGVIIHGKKDRSAAPHIVNAAFEGVGAEVLLHTLEDSRIFISAGSACSTHKRSASPTLTAMHVPAPEMDSSVRFSFCSKNTKDEIDLTVKVLSEVLPMLRRYRAH